MLLDLDEIDRLPRRLRLFSHNRFNALSFFDADHGDGSGRRLRDQVEDHLRAAGLPTDGGAIRLFCMPWVFGYGFNPLSVYFCYQRDGSLAAILYEVHNIFRERHSYLIPVDRDAGVAGAPGAVIDQHCRKGFYVSPFMDMEMSYTFRVAVPDQRVMIAIRAADQDGLLLAAALTGERMALTGERMALTGERIALSDLALLRTLATHPLLTLKVFGAVHWHRLRLLLKGLKLRPRPRPPAAPVTVANTEG